MLTCLAILLLATSAGVAAPGVPGSDPYRTIERWELARSPGGNTLASLLARGEPSVAARAALALGRTGKLLAADPLLQHTQASDSAIRAMVIYGLGLLGPALSGTTLTPMLRPLAVGRRQRAAEAIAGALADGSEAVRIAALDAAGRFAVAHDFTAHLEDATFERAARILRADSSPTVRGRAAYALSYFASEPALRPRAVRALANAFAAEDDDVARWHVMAALADGFAHEVGVKTLSAALADRSDDVRIQALHALARRGDASWMAKVEPLARARDWRVNEEARETLAILRGGKRTMHLTAIPNGVITPMPVPSLEAAPLPRPVTHGKLTAPTLAQMRLDPHVLPHTVAEMTGPASGSHPRVAIVTTQGTIALVLFPEWAPSTVANFLNLAARGYYDGLRWFRIVPDFVVQSGDPRFSAHPREEPNFRIPAEENPVEQDAGIISMALEYDKNGAVRDSAGTQFYITLSPQPHLDQAFTVFGRIESGFDVLGRLVESDRIIRIERLPDQNLQS
jgi:peptidyl-prolyl cis-trans isomerase B (cyclophilin B)